MSNLLKKWRFRLNKKGFTLIELLIVLVIIAILMAIIMPNVLGQKKRIEQQARIDMAQVIETQAHTYELAESDTDGVTLKELQDNGYLTEKQVQEAKHLLALEPETTLTFPISTDEPAKPASH